MAGMISSKFRKAFSLATGLLSVSASPRKWGVFVETWERTGFDRAFSVSYSQGAEDLVLLMLVFGNCRGSYIDIGAHDPDRFSVTRLLYSLGWSGVNVEANVEARQAFSKRRTRDTFVHAVVGNPEGEETHRQFWVFRERALSTSDPTWRDAAIAAGEEVVDSVQVPLITLSTLFEDYFSSRTPELLVIDTEGSDLDVLESNDWERFKPSWIVVESPIGVPEALTSKPVTYLMSLGYVPAAVLPMSTILVLNQASSRIDFSRLCGPSETNE